jgi:hypothetical protein
MIEMLTSRGSLYTYLLKKQVKKCCWAQASGELEVWVTLFKAPREGFPHQPIQVVVNHCSVVVKRERERERQTFKSYSLLWWPDNNV